MANDREDTLKKAEKLLRQGRLDGAIAEYVRLAADQPRDWATANTLGDLYVRAGQPDKAVAQYARIAEHFFDDGFYSKAAALYRKILKITPDDKTTEKRLAELYVKQRHLDRDTAGDDPALLMALADNELRSGNLDRARELLPRALASHPDLRSRAIELGWALADSSHEAAFVCIESAVDAAIAARDFEDAAAVLQEFVTRLPGQVRALLKLIEVCMHGSLEASLYEARAQLTDAYLAAGQASEARAIAEDLVAREPWEPAHIDRFRRALIMLRVPDPDAVIAERLSGQTPFVATDPFPAAAPPAPFGHEPDPTPKLPAVPAPARPKTSPARTRAHTAAKRPHDAPKPATAGGPREPALPPAGQPSGPAQPAPRRPPGSMEIDLSSVLGELEGTPVPPLAPAPVPTPPPENLDAVFKDFREDATRQEVADQSAQQMTLAKTYLEIGMTDEAIEPLQIAARSPRHRFEAGLLLAGLYKQRGDTAHAVEWMERAAEVPAPTEEAGRALLYNLAATLEAAGETSRALAVFMELQADAGDYRDVQARVDRLARVQTGG